MTLREELLRRILDRQGEIVELCQALVRIPSEDPPGDTRPIAAYLQDYLRARGVATRLYSAEPARPNLVGRIPFGAPGPNVVFNGHMETLPAGDRARWRYEPFDGTLADGRLYGRGASCMKGGIASLVSAALALQAHAAELAGSLTLAFVSDEVNGGGLGTGHLVEHVPEARGDVALVGEGGPAIVVGYKGPVFVEIAARGEGGHGAYGFARASAIHRMTEVLHEIRRLEAIRVAAPPELRPHIEAARAATDALYGAGATDALMRVTVNVGTIQGGRKVNMIAETCAAQVDCRIPPGMTVAELLERLHAIAERHPGVTVRTLWANEPTSSDPAHPWFRLLQRNSPEILGSPLPFRVSHGFTDARFFQLKGIPAAAIGRRGGNVGAPDEYIEVDSLVRTTQLFAVSAGEYLAERKEREPAG